MVTRSARTSITVVCLMLLCVLLFTLDMMSGSTPLSVKEVTDALIGQGDATTVMIVRELRLVKAVIAVIAGAALSVSGLQMQVLFRNPLAGPYVLGITSGASLGVAMLILGVPVTGLTLGGAWGSLSVAAAAWIGAASVLVVIAAVSLRVRDIMTVLILGMMFSAGTGAIVQVLQFLSRDDALKSFVVWSMGSLGDVTVTQLWIIAPVTLAGFLIAVATVKPLNLLQLGEQYAVTMGLQATRSRNMIFLSTVLLAGTVTAFCGPIGFVGLAVPHIARRLFDTADARILLPASILCGSAMMLLCDVISRQWLLPVNAVTSLLGIPVVIYLVWNVNGR